MSVDSHVVQHLAEIAKELGLEAQARHRQAHAELLQLEAIISQKRTAAEAASMAHKRSLNFSPALGRELLCPDCWVNRGNQSALRPIPGTDDTDIMKCSVCHEKYPIPIER